MHVGIKPLTCHQQLLLDSPDYKYKTTYVMFSEPEFGKDDCDPAGARVNQLINSGVNRPILNDRAGR